MLIGLKLKILNIITVSIVGLLFLMTGFQHEISAQQLRQNSIIESAGWHVGVLRGHPPSAEEPLNFSFGVLARHEIDGTSFFGEAGIGLGTVSNPKGRSRLLPIDYRLNYKLSTPGSGTLKDDSFLRLAYVFLGIGLLHHRPVEVHSENPLTEEMGKFLPPSSFWQFESGWTPFVPFGLGMEFPLDPSAALNIQLGYHHSLDSWPTKGEGFHSGYWKLTVGLNFKTSKRQKPIPPVDVPQPPPARTVETAVPPVSPEGITEKKSPEQEKEYMAHISLPALCYEAFEYELMTHPENKFYYRVQLGAFSNQLAAQNFVRSLSMEVPEQPQIRFDAEANLYKVQIPAGHDLEKTRQLIESVTGIPELTDSFIVSEPGNVERLSGTGFFHVQLGAFSSRQNAERFIQSLEDEWRQRSKIRHAAGADLYKVAIPTGHELNRARDLLSEVRSSPGLSDSIIYFECKEDLSVLERVLSLLNEHPELKLHIKGYAYEEGRDQLRDAISDKRSERVKTYFLEHGVKENRLISKGFGDRHPVDTVNIFPKEAPNRRVELHLK